MRTWGIAFIVVALILAGHSSAVLADQDEAKRLWKDGATAYNLGDFERAEELFKLAYAQSSIPEILFNLCQARRQLAHYRLALHSCRAFLERRPEALNREVVEQLIEEMTELEAKQRESNDRPPTSVIEAEPARAGASPQEVRDGTDEATPANGPWYDDPVGWSAVGVGLTTVSIGAVFLLQANGLERDADQELDVQRALELQDDADGRRTLGAVVTLVGGAVSIAGAALLAIHDSGPAGGGVTLVLSPHSIGVTGRF